MIIYLYVNNKDLPEAEQLARQAIGEDDKLRFRNPVYFGQSGEVTAADKVLLYGKYDAVLNACQKHDVPLTHLTYDGEQVEATGESKTPSMDWLKDDLVAWAEANGVDINSGDTKADIIEKINEVSES